MNKHFAEAVLLVDIGSRNCCNLKTGHDALAPFVARALYSHFLLLTIISIVKDSSWTRRDKCTR